MSRNLNQPYIPILFDELFESRESGQWNDFKIRIFGKVAVKNSAVANKSNEPLRTFDKVSLRDINCMEHDDALREVNLDFQ